MKHVCVIGREVGTKTSTDRDQHWNSSVLLSKLTGDRRGVGRQRGQGQKAVQVTRAETTRRGQGKEGRSQGSNPGNDTRELMLLSIWMYEVVKSQISQLSCGISLRHAPFRS